MKKLYAMLAGICMSAAVAQAQCYEVTKTSDIEFDTAHSLLMDIYTPVGAPAGAHPLLIMAHGGSFVGGTKAEGTSSEIARRFASRGYTTASINYRLEASSASLLDSSTAAGAVIRAVSDMKGAIRFFKYDAFNANLYNVDTTAVYVGGNSAGAITAVNLAFLTDTTEVRANDNIILSAIRNNGGLEGNSGHPGYSARVNGVLNFAGGVKDTLWIDANDPKVFSAHGDADRTVPYLFDMVLKGTTGGFLKTITLNGSGAMEPRLSEVGVTNVLKRYLGDDHVPWETSTAKFNEIDSIAAVFLGAPTCYRLGLVGINDIKNNVAVSLYPNPATTQITISAEHAIESVNVVDNLGRIVATYPANGTETQVDVAKLGTGLYTAKINLKGAYGSVVRSFTVK